MAGETRIFPDLFVPNAEGSSYHPKWEKANPNGDAPKWRAFRDAVRAYEKGDGITVPSMATKYGKALVAAGKLHMSVIDLGAEWETPPPPPPPGGGTLPGYTALDDFNDWSAWIDSASAQWGPRIFFRRWRQPTPIAGSGVQYRDEDQAGAQLWSDGSGIFLVSTPYGQGFRFVQNASVSRGSGSGVKIVDVNSILPTATYLGTTIDFITNVMYPSSGNPNGFPPFSGDPFTGDWLNVLEWSDGGTGVFRRIGQDPFAPGGRRFYAVRFDPSNPSSVNAGKVHGPLIVMDQWYKHRWKVKFTKDSSGSIEWWVDDVQYMSFFGQTVRSDEGAQFLEFGWYGMNTAGRNEIRHGGIQYKRN